MQASNLSASCRLTGASCFSSSNVCADHARVSNMPMHTMQMLSFRYVRHHTTLILQQFEYISVRVNPRRTVPCILIIEARATALHQAEG